MKVAAEGVATSESANGRLLMSESITYAAGIQVVVAAVVLLLLLLLLLHLHHLCPLLLSAVTTLSMMLLLLLLQLAIASISGRDWSAADAPRMRSARRDWAGHSAGRIQIAIHRRRQRWQTLV